MGLQEWPPSILICFGEGCRGGWKGLRTLAGDSSHLSLRDDNKCKGSVPTLRMLDPSLPYCKSQLIRKRDTPAKGGSRGTSDVTSVWGAPQKMRQSLRKAVEEAGGDLCIVIGAEDTSHSWKPRPME